MGIRTANGRLLFCNSYGGKLDENSCKHAISRYNKLRELPKLPSPVPSQFAKNWINYIFRFQKVLGHSSIETVRNM